MNSSCKNTFVNFCDMYGDTMPLKIFKKNYSKTIIGSIMTLISLGLMGAVTIYFLIGLFERRSRQIIVNDDSQTYSVIDLNDSPVVLEAYQFKGTKLPLDGTIFNIYGFYNNAVYNNGTYNGLTFMPLNFKNCNKNYSKYISEEALTSDKKCLTNTSLLLNGFDGETERGFSFLWIVFTKCRNNTNSKIMCKSQETIDEIADNGVAFALTTPTYTVDHNNISSPRNLKLSTFYLTTNNGLTKQMKIYLAQNFYQDDYGLIFDSNKTYSFYTEGSTLLEYFLPSTMPNPLYNDEAFFSSYMIYGSSYVKRTYRSYMKAQACLANIGGIVKFISIIASSITHILTRKLIYYDLGNYLFDYRDSDYLKKKMQKSISLFKEKNPEGKNLNDSNFKKNENSSIKLIQNDALKIDIMSHSINNNNLIEINPIRQNPLDIKKNEIDNNQDKNGPQVNFQEPCLKNLTIIDNVIMEDNIIARSIKGQDLLWKRKTQPHTNLKMNICDLVCPSFCMSNLKTKNKYSITENFIVKILSSESIIKSSLIMKLIIDCLKKQEILKSVFNENNFWIYSLDDENENA